MQRHYSQIFLSWQLGRSCNTAKSISNYTQIIHQWHFLLPNKENLPKYNFRNTNSWHVAQWVSRDTSDTPPPTANLKKSDYS